MFPVCLFSPLIKMMCAHPHALLTDEVEDIIFIFIISKAGLMNYYILMTGSHLVCSEPGGHERAHITTLNLTAIVTFVNFAPH